MADVRLLVQEEGRAARNLIAFNVPLESDNVEKITRKPPSVPKLVQAPNSKRSIKSNARVRSASTGRDKRSELQARYWAFLFGNLQRAVDAIYETCEEDENISECKEVILVLENYTRDFHSLTEWFKVKWAYETSPPPLRRTPLAWEVRKTSPCRMWNGSVMPKPTSPLLRISPTSPFEHPIIEDRVTPDDNKNESTVNQAKSDVLKNTKMIKESKNKNSKDDGKTLKEKTASTPATATKLNTRPSNIYKRTVSTKSQENEKVLTEDSTNVARPNTDGKNNLSRNTCRPQSSVNRTKSANSQTSNNVNNENNVDSMPKKNNETKKELEATKNQINTNLNKNSTVNGLRPTLSCISNKTPNKPTPVNVQKSKSASAIKPAYSTISRMKSTLNSPSSYQQQEIPKLVRSKTTLSVRGPVTPNKTKPGTSVIVRKRSVAQGETTRRYNSIRSETEDMSASVEVLHPHSRVLNHQNDQNGSQTSIASPATSARTNSSKEDVDGWQTVRSRYRRSSTHNLNMSTRYHKPSTATSLPALCINSPSEKNRQKRRSVGAKLNKNAAKAEPLEKLKIEKNENNTKSKEKLVNEQPGKSESSVHDVTASSSTTTVTTSMSEGQSTSLTIAAIFKSDAELLEKRIQQFMAAQAERERIILEEERKTEEADSQRSKQLSDEEALLQRQILELESTDIDVDTETDETDGEMVLDVEEDVILPVEGLNTEAATSDADSISLEDRYETMLEGMSWAERMDTLAQLQDLVARHPGRALELHQKLSSPSRKRSLPETLRRYQAKQACAQHKRQKLLMEKSQRLRELLNKVEDVKTAKNQLIEDKRMRLEQKLKRAEEKRTQHLLEVVRKAHDEDSKLKEIAFINELEAQNKRHDFMALCQEQEERLQGIQEERQRRQEEKAAKEAAVEERRKALEAERQLRIQRMRQARQEREERVGKMQLEREKERQEQAREKARDREERLSALHAAQLANQEELQKKIAQKQQDSARRHVENIEHIRQRALESSIIRSEFELPPTLKSYPCPKQCVLCSKVIPNEVCLLSHLKGKAHLEAVRRVHENREPCRDELHKFNITQIKDAQQSTSANDDNRAVKERQKALKRRSRKIKQRMLARSSTSRDDEPTAKESAPVDSANKANFRRNLKELDKLCQNHAKSTWSSVAVSGLDRCLGQIARAFSKTCPLDQEAFSQLGGFETLTNLLNLALNNQNALQTLPNKSIVSICRIYVSALNGHQANIEAVLLSNKVIVILDLFLQRLEMVTSLDDGGQAQEVSGNANSAVAASAGQLLCALVPEAGFDKTALQSRLQDLTSYLMTSGLIERLSRHSRALVETDYLLDQDRDSPLLLAGYDLLSRLCGQFSRSSTNSSESTTTSSIVGCAASESSDSVISGPNAEPSVAQAHLLSQLESSEAAGAIGALYAAVALTALQASSADKRTASSASPTPSQQVGLSPATKNLAARGLRLLRSIAELDLHKLQNLLGSEGTSLQWRLISSHLLTKLSRDLPEHSDSSAHNKALLGELFLVLGYFAIGNIENQLVLQSAGVGVGPSVLQQLCTLPFPFYGDPQLASFTLPTLLALTHDNAEARAVLSCEMSYQLLEEYRDSESGRTNPILRLLRSSTTNP